jgi:hypothetical protein
MSKDRKSDRVIYLPEVYPPGAISKWDEYKLAPNTPGFNLIGRSPNPESFDVWRFVSARTSAKEFKAIGAGHENPLC